MASKELITKIILKGTTDPSLSKAFGKVSKLSNTGLQNLQKAGQMIGTVAKTGAVAVGAGLGASAKAYIDYESAFAGVMKTVDETGTTTYEKLSDGIRNMSKQLPASATEIAGVAEAAGQLGIKADDILSFTKTMIDLGESTNLTSDEAATSIAKLFNVTGTSMSNVDRFGATLVALGNNAATTESDILAMATRIAGSGKQIGLSEQQILALSTSLSSVGIEAEMGGSAISTVMTQIDKDIALNNDTVSTWAKTAGMSVGQFKKLWGSDAYGAIQKIVAGLGSTKDAGGNLNVLLDDLGIKSIRTSDTMKRLSSASGLMNDMTSLANQAWSENTALTEEAGRRYATIQSKIQILKNKFVDFGIAVGERLAPHIETFIDKLSSIDFEGIANKIGGVIDWIAKHSTTLLTIAGVIAGAFVGIKIAGLVKGIMTAVKIISVLVKSFGFAKVALAAMGGPVTLVIAIIGALVGAFIVLWKKSETFRNFWIGLWNGIKSICSTVGNWLKTFFTVTIPTAFNSFVEKCKSVGNSIKNFFTVTIPTAFNNFKAKVVQIVSNAVTGIINFFQQLPYKIGYFIGFCIGKVIQFGQKLRNFATVTIPQFISNVITWFAQLPSRIWTWLSNAIAKVTAWGSRMISLGKAKAMQFITSVINFFRQLPSKVWSWLVKTAQKVVSWGSQLASKGKSAAVKLMNAIVNTAKQIPGKMLSIGKNVVKGIWNGISNAKSWLIGKVKSFAKGITDGIKNALGINSPSVVMEKLFKWVPVGAGEGIIKNAKYAVNAVKSMGGKVAKTASKISPTISTKVATVGQKIKAFANGGTVTTPQTAIVGDAPETIVPHGNTPRNRSLLKDAARGVGASIGNKTYHFIFAPTINGGSVAETKKMLEEEMQKFKQMMKEYIEEEARLAY